MTLRSSKCLGLILGLGLVLWLGLAPLAGLAADAAPVSATGNYYIVQRGDTWVKIAARNGLTVNQLIAANPALVRPHYVIWPGDRMFIPLPATPPSPGGTGYWYTVKRGDTWQTVSRDTGVPVLDLWHANPGQLYPNRWLYTGTRLWIPAPARAAAAPPAPPAATAASVGPSVAITATATITATAPAATPPAVEITPTVTMTATAPAATAPAVEITPTVTMTATAPTATPPAVEITSTATMTATAPAATAPAVEITATATMTATAPAATAPAVEITSTATMTATAPAATAPAVEITSTATMTATAPAAATPIPLAPSTPVTATAAATAPAAAAAIPGGCFATLADYDNTITAYLNTPGNTADGLKAWLSGCGVIKPSVGSVTVAAVHAAGSHDVVVAISDATQSRLDAPGRLLVYHEMANGYVLAGVAQAQGMVTVISLGDANADGQGDIIWTDTVCDSGPCNSTLFVDSWTGNGYRSWLQDQPMTTDAQYSLRSMAGASGLAIVITGTLSSAAPAPAAQATPGAQATPTAGPRTTTEVWVSQNGGLYHRQAEGEGGPGTSMTPGLAQPAAETPAAPTAPATGQPATGGETPGNTPSVIQLPGIDQGGGAAAAATPATAATTGPCLADRIQDANMIFNAWGSNGFGPAIQTYQSVLNDPPNACTLSADQVSQMLDFARFRLMLAMIGNGAANQAPAYRNQIQTAALKGVADAFMTSYTDSHSIVQACRDATAYAQAHPESWQFLAAGGGAASFTADDVCPLAK